MADGVRYVGNPEHKRNPGDFGLTPPSSPRLGKSLCDAVNVLSRAQATRLLKKGIRDGLVSVQEENGWPRLVWTMLDGNVLEARLDNAELGTYHGYPLDHSDPFCASVNERWIEA